MYTFLTENSYKQQVNFTLYIINNDLNKVFLTNIFALHRSTTVVSRLETWIE